MCLTKSPTKRTRTQHLKSRKFNKFMSIIILNDSIILERCVYAFENWILQKAGIMMLNRVNDRVSEHEAYGTW